MIVFEQISKRFGSKQVLDRVDLTLRAGGASFIIGASGAGKSVLVRHAVGLLKPDSGRVRVAGTDITCFNERQLEPIRRRCGYVFQHSTLLDGLTVLENVALPLRSHLKMGRRRAREQAGAHLEAMGLLAMSQRYPQELGAGTRKQVAICRSLILKPDVLIFDEPTTGLDTAAARHIDRLIRDLCDEHGVTAVVVSHDRRSILDISDTVAFLYQGRIYASGQAKQLLLSGDPIVRQFLEGRSDGPMEV